MTLQIRPPVSLDGSSDTAHYDDTDRDPDGVRAKLKGSYSLRVKLNRGAADIEYFENVVCSTRVRKSALPFL